MTRTKIHIASIREHRIRSNGRVPIKNPLLRFSLADDGLVHIESAAGHRIHVAASDLILAFRLIESARVSAEPEEPSR